MNIADKTKAIDIAKNWRVLNDRITELTTEQIEFLIITEKTKQKPRTTIIERLRQRYKVLMAEEAMSNLE